MPFIPQPSIVEQAVYSWSSRTLGGSRGFGFVAASNGLHDSLSWLDTCIQDLKEFEPQRLRKPSDLGRYSIPFRLVVGNSAIIGKKTYQGNTTGGRPGRFAIQMLLGYRDDLTLSRLLLMNARHWRKPLTMELDAPVDLRPLKLESFSFNTSSKGAGRATGELLFALSERQWQELIVDEVALDLIPGMLGALPAEFDLHATLVPFVDTAVGWRFRLNQDIHGPFRQQDYNGRDGDGRVVEGDDDWLFLRDKLERCSSLGSVQSFWEIYSDEFGRRAHPVAEVGVEEQEVPDAVQANPATLFEKSLSAFQSFNEPREAERYAIEMAIELASNGITVSPTESNSGALSEFFIVLENAGRPDLVEALCPESIAKLVLLASKVVTVGILRSMLNSAARTGRWPDWGTDRVHDVQALCLEVVSQLADENSREAAKSLLSSSGLHAGCFIEQLLQSRESSDSSRACILSDIVPQTFSALEIHSFADRNFSEVLAWMPIPSVYKQFIMFRSERRPFLLTPLLWWRNSHREGLSSGSV